MRIKMVLLIGLSVVAVGVFVQPFATQETYWHSGTGESRSVRTVLNLPVWITPSRPTSLSSYLQSPQSGEWVLVRRVPPGLLVNDGYGKMLHQTRSVKVLAYLNLLETRPAMTELDVQKAADALLEAYAHRILDDVHQRAPMRSLAMKTESLAKWMEEETKAGRPLSPAGITDFNRP